MDPLSVFLLKEGNLSSLVCEASFRAPEVRTAYPMLHSMAPHFSRFLLPPSLSLFVCLSRRNARRLNVTPCVSGFLLRLAALAPRRLSGGGGQRVEGRNAVLNSAGCIRTERITYACRCGRVVPSAWLYLISQSAQPLRSPCPPPVRRSLLIHPSHGYPPPVLLGLSASIRHP